MPTAEELQAQATQTSINFMRQALEASKRILAEREATLANIESQQSSLPSLSSIRELRAQAAALTNTNPAKAAELTAQANELQLQRSDYNSAKEAALFNVTQSKEAVSSNERQLADLEAKAAANPASGIAAAVPASGQNPVVQQTENLNTAQSNVPVSTNVTTTTTSATTVPAPEPAINGLDLPPNPESINGLDLPPTPEPINGLDLPPTPEPINGLDLPPNPEPINGLDLPPTPADEFGDLDTAIERQQASEPVLSEDGEVATGVRRNTETGEIYYTDPPKGDDLPFDEFAGVDEAVAEQKRIATNTAGLPVLAEDGSVAEGVAINPETGETYYTTPARGLAATQNARRQATEQDVANFKTKEDWRVRLSLAPESKYLYNAPEAQGILQPLAATDGVIFPYTPNIQVQYAAHYTPTDLTHSNYKIFQYANSSVDSISITCDFTAQDTTEANYLLAVIHFFRTVTKMFYGQDKSPKAGTPPPLCYLSGLGQFQFDAHPLAVTAFTYSLPTDVDYIRASATTTAAGVNKSPANVPINTSSPAGGRMTGINPGGVKPPPRFQTTPAGTIEPTYVPTKMQIQISAVPIISRNDISNNFSLKKYATGELLLGAKNKRAGMW